MRDFPRQILAEIVLEYGRSICDDPERCERLLLDLCGEFRPEIFVLVHALKERVAVDLLTASSVVPRSVLLAQLSQRLQGNLALSEEAAHWAVSTWAEALGVIPPGNSSVDQNVTISGPRPPPGRAISPLSITSASVPAPAPVSKWYLSNWFSILAFVLLTPVWAVLTVLNRTRPRESRVLAGVVGVEYVMLIVYLLGGAPLASSLLGPSPIIFGSSYSSASNDINVINEKSQFTAGEPTAWVAHLRGPTKTSTFDEVLSNVSSDGTETQVASTRLTITDPNSTVIGHKLSKATIQDAGIYRLRLIAGDNVLAWSDFAIQP